MKSIMWGYPVKNYEKARKKLAKDLRFYGGDGVGNCAKLDERNPRIVEKRHRDGFVWYHTEVDDVVLPLELE